MAATAPARRHEPWLTGPGVARTGSRGSRLDAWTTFDLGLERAYLVNATTRWWKVITNFSDKHLR